MSTSHVLLLTLTCFCQVYANQWCYCDNDLCTTDYYAPMREVCPDIMPDAMKKKILGMFFNSNKEKLSLQTFMEMMIEKGFDQSRIAEMVRGIIPSDITKLEKALGEKYSKKLSSVLMEMDKPTMQYIMEGEMDVLREVRANQHLQLSDEEFAYVKAAAIEALSRLPLSEDEKNLIIRNMTKFNVANFLSNATMMNLEKKILYQKKELDIDATRELWNGKIMQHPLNMIYKNFTEDEIRQKKIQMQEWFAEEGFSQFAIDEMLRLLDEHTDRIDVYLRPLSTLADMDKYILDHTNYSETEAIIEFLKELGVTTKRQLFLMNGRKGSHGDSEEVIPATLQKLMNKKKAQLIYTNLNGYTSMLFYPTIELWKSYISVDYNGTDIIGPLLDTLPNLSKSVDTDLLEIARAVHDLMKQVSNRTAMKVTPQKAEVEQFCLKVALRTGKSFRLCGHLAAQLTGFNFREGCHYEQILGIPDGNFCRCNDYLCNPSGRPSGNKLLNVLSMIVLLFSKASAFL